MLNAFPYSIPVNRELSMEERKILRHLVSESYPERINETNSLRVLARCGCGACPTVMFEPEPKREREKRILADFQGGDIESSLVGISLWESDGKISELEAWSIDGSDVESWPEFNTIKPLEISRVRNQ